MALVRRIFVSLPSRRALSPERNAFRDAVLSELKKLEEHAYQLVTLNGWTRDELDRTLSRCVGGVIIGLAHGTGTVRGKTVEFASEYLHYEGAVMETLGLPVLALLDPAIEQRRGAFHGDRPAVRIERIDAAWLSEEEFRVAFEDWVKKIEDRKDVFLAYSSGPKNEQIVANLKEYFGSQGVKVLDWKSGFSTGDTVYESLANSVANCSAGVFLLTKDDQLKNGKYVPRDNVIFEAGLFCHAKGRRRALLMIEREAKKPSDLEGVLHVDFDEPFQLDAVKRSIDKLVANEL